MRGEDLQQHELFSYGSLEERVPSDHPLRPIRAMVDEALKALDGRFNEIYGEDGRKSIPPERLLRALLLQLLYTVRSERMLMEQLEYNLLFRWFVGLSANEPVWHPTVFTKNRDRLLEGAVAEEFFSLIVNQTRQKRLLSDEHFTVDGTLVEAWAGQKSFQAKKEARAQKEPPSQGAGSNPDVNFRQEKRSNQTHQSLTDPGARLFKKARGAEAKLAYLGHVVTENRNGLVVDTRLTLASGTAERDAAMAMLEHKPAGRRVTLGRSWLRHQKVRGRPTRFAGDSACSPEHEQPAKRGGWTNHTARRLRGEPAETETRGGSVRLVEDGSSTAQDQIPGAGPSRMDVHLRGGGIQPGSDAKPDGTGWLRMAGRDAGSSSCGSAESSRKPSSAEFNPRQALETL